jgi:hypothetical protein
MAMIMSDLLHDVLLVLVFIAFGIGWIKTG